MSSYVITILEYQVTNNIIKLVKYAMKLRNNFASILALAVYIIHL